VEGENSTSSPQPYRAEITNQITPEISTKGKGDEAETQLFQILQKAWVNIREMVIEGLISSMPRRCAAVIKAKGWHTKYRLRNRMVGCRWGGTGGDLVGERTRRLSAGYCKRGPQRGVPESDPKYCYPPRACAFALPRLDRRHTTLNRAKTVVSHFRPPG